MQSGQLYNQPAKLLWKDCGLYNNDRDYKPSKSFRSTRTDPYKTRPKTELVDSLISNNSDSATESEVRSLAINRQENPIIIEEEAVPKDRTMASGDNLTRLLEMMMTQESEQQQREERRERERERQEEERECRDREWEERHQRLMEQLVSRRPHSSSPTVLVPAPVFPRMAQGDNAESYLVSLEAALLSSATPEGEWKTILLGHTDQATRHSMMDLLQDPDCSYENIKNRMLAESGLTTITAADRFHSPGMGGATKMNPSQLTSSLWRWLIKLTEGAKNVGEALEKVLITRARAEMTQEGKSFINLRRPQTRGELIASLMEWTSTFGSTESVFKTTDPVKRSQPYSTNKQGKSCFHCGKSGHMAKDCWNRQRQQREEEQKPIPTPARESKPVICFACREVGHRSTECPNKKTVKSSKTVRKVEIQKEATHVLYKNNLMAKIGEFSFPMIMDSGAQVTLVPREFVDPKDPTGETIKARWGRGKAGEMEAEKALVRLKLGNEQIECFVGAVPGDLIEWTGMYEFDLSREADRLLWMAWEKKREGLTEDQMRFISPGVHGGEVKGAVWEPDRAGEGVVSLAGNGQGEVVVESVLEGTHHTPSTDAVTVVGSVRESTDHGIEAEGLSVADAPVGVEAVECSEKALVGGNADSSVLEEAYVESLGGSAVSEAVGSREIESKEVAQSLREVTMQLSEETSARDELKKAIREDESLTSLRRLADTESNGYSWEDGLLFRHRLDELGRNKKQLCLPVKCREKCLKLAHEKFGHRGKNKVACSVQRFFYWPSLWRDVAHHCKSCESCQKTSKISPRPNPMQEREVVTVPSDRVCVDIVGPLPKSKKGYTHLLTYIDVASQWPEAIPLKSTTFSLVIQHLTDIFTRNGFPRVLITDNGSQFVSNQMKSFCNKHHIQKVETAPYRPQSNGVVELFHGTLEPMLTKCIDDRQDWSAMVPMVLYLE